MVLLIYLKVYLQVTLVHFFGGVKKIFLDFPIKLVSYIGDAFFSLIENALAAFGIEPEMVTNIKETF